MNEQIKSVSAIPPAKVRDPRPARVRNARGHATWKALQDHGDDLIRVGQIAKETRSVITRFVLVQHLTPVEGEAAKRYAYIVARFEKYNPDMRRNIKSPSYEKAFGSDQELEKHQRNGTIADYEAASRKATREYNKLMRAIDAYGPRTKSVLDDFCLSDLEPDAGFRQNLAVVLRAIVTKFGITAPLRRGRGKRR